MKTGREAGAGAFAFLEINDGSCFESLQVRATAGQCTSSTSSSAGQQLSRRQQGPPAPQVLRTQPSAAAQAAPVPSWQMLPPAPALAQLLA